MFTSLTDEEITHSRDFMCSNYGKKICVLSVFGICGLASFIFLASIFEQEVIFENPKELGGETPNGEYRNLLHVLQISDVHVSKFHEPQRITDFKKFW